MGSFYDSFGQWISSERADALARAGQMPQAKLTGFPSNPPTAWPSQTRSPQRQSSPGPAPTSSRVRGERLLADIEAGRRHFYELEQGRRTAEGQARESLQEYEVRIAGRVEQPRAATPSVTPELVYRPAPAPATYQPAPRRGGGALTGSLLALAVVVAGGYAYLHAPHQPPALAAQPTALTPPPTGHAHSRRLGRPRPHHPHRLRAETQTVAPERQDGSSSAAVRRVLFNP